MFQRFVQVFRYVVDMLDAERKPQQVGIYARSGQFLFAELGVREVLPMLRLDASESVTPETDAEPWLGELVTALRA